MKTIVRKIYFVGLALVFFLFLFCTSSVGATTFTKPLALGSRHPEVKSLQTVLKAQGFYSYPDITGYFGPVTKAAVKAFQKANNLEAVGSVGPLTRALLTKLSQQTTVLPVGCLVGHRFNILTGASCETVLSGLPHDTTTASSSSLIATTATTTPPPPPLPPPPPVAPQVTYPSGTILTPGPGFTGPTSEPAPIGSGAGSDAKAIARWDVVPYQTFDTTMNIGVVAFHMNDIDHVSFSVNGGPWTPIYSMTLNPQTQVTEYWATLRAQDFADGPVEVRAIAYPKVGVPRVLQGATIGANGEYSLTLYANSRGSLNPETMYVSKSGSDTNPGTYTKPVATISKAMDLVKEGGIIDILDPGSYSANLAPSSSQNSAGRTMKRKRWVTIQGDPSLSQSQVVINEPVRTFVRPFFNMERWRNVTMDFGTISQYYSNGTMWFDNVRWYDSSGWIAHENSMVPVSAYTKAFYTNSQAEDMLYGFVGAQLIRNSSLQKISGDALQNSKMVLNTTVRTVGGTSLAHHADLYQTWNAVENHILYGVTATDISSQSIFIPAVDGANSSIATPFTNSAFVNVSILNNDANHLGGPPFSQMSGPYTHVLFKNVALPGQRLIFRLDNASVPFAPRLVIFRNCELHPLTYADFVTKPAPSGVSFENCYSSQNPTSRFSADPTGGAAPLTVSFDASASQGGVNTYSWDFGDGVTGTGITTTHTYTTEGTFTIKLTITDAAGRTDQLSKTIAINSNIKPGLLVLLDFEQDTKDHSGYAYTVTCQNGCPSLGAGKNGQGGIFDGTTSSPYLTISHASLLDGMSELTLAFWAKRNTAGIGGNVINKHVTYSIGLGSSVSAYLITQSGTRLDISSTLANDTNWHHYALTYDGKDVRLYIDGAQVATKPLTGAIAINPTRTIAIGKDPWGKAFNGTLDDIRIYNRALSASEISGL